MGAARAVFFSLPCRSGGSATHRRCRAGVGTISSASFTPTRLRAARSPPAPRSGGGEQRSATRARAASVRWCGRCCRRLRSSVRSIPMWRSSGGSRTRTTDSEFYASPLEGEGRRAKRSRGRGVHRPLGASSPPSPTPPGPEAQAGPTRNVRGPTSETSDVGRGADEQGASGHAEQPTPGAFPGSTIAPGPTAPRKRTQDIGGPIAGIASQAALDALAARRAAPNSREADKVWMPHRPPRPEKSEGGVPLVIKSDFEPKGDQPQAIADLVEGVQRHDRTQVLLGVTGSGKTFTMAKVIEATQRPALILAPNKTLAAQLYGEFKQLLSRQRGRVFRLLLRLLPAGSLRPAHRHLYREGILDQRADRPHAPFGDARAARTRRRRSSSRRCRASTVSARSRPIRR